MSGAALAEAAEELVGVRFRLHGRDPLTGLDCIGVLAAALAAIGRPAPLPTGYRLRMREVARFADHAQRCGLSPAAAEFATGDVVIAQPSPCQAHLLIAAGPRRFVHAHAAIGRVVVHTGECPWPIVHRWRLTSL